MVAVTVAIVIVLRVLNDGNLLIVRIKGAIARCSLQTYNI